jgi:hypothetical protein
MYKDAYNDRHKLVQLGLSDEYVKKAQKGLYDEIICPSCEKESQEFDHYASLILTNRSPQSYEYLSVKRNYQEKVHDGNLRKFSLWEGIDFLKFQKFIFICILRTHFSNLKKGKPLLIEKHFNNIRDLYRSSNIINASSYPIIALNYLNNNGFEHILLMPFANKKDGHFFVEFSGSKYNFIVYVSSHKRPQYVSSLKLQENGSLYIIHDYMENTGTYKTTMSSVVGIVQKYPKFKI